MDVAGLRSLVLVLALALIVACGGLWACGRKAAPRLPEGELLQTGGEGFQRPISVYSPYEEEVAEEIEETGVALDTGVEEGELPEREPDLVVEPPEEAPAGTIRRRAPGETYPEEAEEELEVGEVAPPSAPTRPPGKAGADPTERLRRGLEDLLSTEEEQPADVGVSPTQPEGLPPSPGGPLEGGF